MTFPRQHYGAKAPTKQALATALRSALILRRRGKPLSPGDIAGFARCYGRSEDQVVQMAREMGCEVGA